MPVALCAAAAAVWIVALILARPVPSEDGVSYLWMAERFAMGEWRDALSTVFPPGFPLLIAPLIAAGLPLEAAADAVNTAAFALTVWPLAAIARRLVPAVSGADLAACVLFWSGSLLTRVAAEVYSEPAFLLLMAWGTAAGLAGRHGLCGALAGAAFWIRPEGLLLAASFALARPREGWRALLGAALGVALLGALRWHAGHGFDPLPLLAFHEGRDDLPQRGAVLTNLLALPGAWLEAFGLVGLVLLAWLVPRARRSLPSAPALWWQIALQLLVVCTFVVRRRFLLSCAVPVVALAGAAVARLRPAPRAAVLLVAVLAGGIGAFTGGIDADRVAERDLGVWLGERLRPGERVTGDLTRVVWFAGQRPLPPRHFDVDELRAMATHDDVRYFVFSARSRRDSSRRIEGALEGLFGRLPLPEPLAAACAERGIVVLARR